MKVIQTQTLQLASGQCNVQGLSQLVSQTVVKALSLQGGNGYKALIAAVKKEGGLSLIHI